MTDVNPQGRRTITSKPTTMRRLFSEKITPYYVIKCHAATVLRLPSVAARHTLDSLYLQVEYIDEHRKDAAPVQQERVAARPALHLLRGLQVAPAALADVQ